MSVWFRNVPWATGDYWRTDISTNTLYSNSVVAARFALKDGPIVQVPMPDLRRALENAPTRKDGRIVGPYNIYPFKKVVEVRRGQTPVPMDFGPFHDLEYDRLTDYHTAKAVPAGNLRPHVAQEYLRYADIVSEKVRNGEATYDQVKERLEQLNPTLTVRVEPNGAISRQELAYCIRLNYLRATQYSHEELL